METAEALQQEQNIQLIKKNSIKSVISLTIRRVILRIVGQIAFILLARILTPSEFGIFTIVSFIVNFFGFFSDIGLAAALIQKKTELTKEDLRTTFTVQQILVGTLVTLIIIFAPYIITTFYKDTLAPEHTFLVQALAFSLLLASLKSIPAVLLERKLMFNKLVIPEIVETMIYNITALVLAYLGYGVWSFVVAVILRGLVGVVLIHIMHPWPIGFALNKHSFKQLYKFGLPYQLNGLVALIKDNVVPTYVAATLGTTAVGYIGWAQKYAFLPLEPMNDIIRVTFPTYARLQEQPELLKRALEKTIYFTTLCVYPLLFGFLALAPWIVEYVFTSKWTQALPLFYLFAINTFWAVLSTTCTNALFAIGKSRIVLNFMILWTILTWIMTPLLTIYYDIYGIAITSALISFTSIGVILITKRYIKVAFIRTIGWQVVASVIMGIAVHVLAQIAVKDFFTLCVAVGVGMGLYTSMIYIFDKKRIRAEMSSIVNSYKK